MVVAQSLGLTISTRMGCASHAGAQLPTKAALSLGSPVKPGQRAPLFAAPNSYGVSQALAQSDTVPVPVDPPTPVAATLDAELELLDGPPDPDVASVDMPSLLPPAPEPTTTLPPQEASDAQVIK